MSHSDTTEDEEADIWDAFDEAVEHAEVQLKEAWTNHGIVQQTESPLSEEYISALTEIEETIQEFDSVYEVTDTELERANRVATNAEFLATVTRAYREYHEGVIERRVSVAQEWFNTLATCVDDTDADIATDQSSLRRQMQALEKLMNAGKYGQLLDSDRIELTDIEERIRGFNQAVQDGAPAESYVTTGIELAESFQDQYTDDLAELVKEGVDRDAISITERVADIPDLEPIVTRLEEDSTMSDDVDAVGTVVETYADIAILTGKRHEKYRLGEKLIGAVEDGPTEIENDFHLGLKSFQLDPIVSLVERIIEGWTTTSDAEQLLKVLARHDGSVQRTSQSLDRPTEDLFDDLRHLFLQDEIADLEVRFE